MNLKIGFPGRGKLAPKVTDEGREIMRNHKPEDENVIEELKEWQENQYNPGHYLGGRIHPFLNNVWKNKAKKLLFITLVSSYFIFLVVILIKSINTKPFRMEQLLFPIIYIILYLGVFINRLIENVKKIIGTKREK